MDSKAIAIVAIFAITFGFLTIATIAKYLSQRSRPAGSKQLEEIAARLANLEQSVDAIAVETERISEGQRFTTKLLSDRAPARSAE